MGSIPPVEKVSSAYSDSLSAKMMEVSLVFGGKCISEVGKNLMVAHNGEVYVLLRPKEAIAYIPCCVK